MSEPTPINSNAPMAGAPNAARKLSCEEWEAMLVDFLDGTLPSSESSDFSSHRESCSGCAEMFAHSGQGREWLNFLRTEPHVSPVLVSKILAQTSGAQSGPVLNGELTPASVVVIPVAVVAPFWKRTSMAAATRVAQPRLMMTAAMAFFSITLSLNMAGVRLSTVRLADLKPAAVSNNLNKQYHMASARVVRYYDNLRFVYEMEARVKELQRNVDQESAPPVDTQDKSVPASTPQDGGRSKSGGKSEAPGSSQPRPVPWGEKVEAALENPLGKLSAADADGRAGQNYGAGGMETTDGSAADQAERGIA